MTLPITQQLAERVERAEMNTLLSRLKGIQKREGNPMRVQMHRFGEAMLFLTPGIPGGGFNKLMGLRNEAMPYLDMILAEFDDANMPYRIDVVPGMLQTESFQTLSKRGLHHLSFHGALVGACKKPVHTTEDVEVRQLARDDFQLYAELYGMSFSMPAFLYEAIAENNVILYDEPGWSFYLATMDGAPAGIASMHVHDDVATLAAAGTLPDYRGRGVHKALLHARMEQAVSQGCELLVGQATFASASQRNMQRCGMQLAYTKAVWGPIPS
ncbi:GNAT family N-acetyltransferase [Aureibacillus halotolerans]|uniref:Acetyltransferase (GNAT) family protein n=1 Tax=Aureibacillus halotolerans TaxID=1508390 RepID=A0A4R6TTH9_9BACI|nr:GNAT family N-acetyltransferase [Aureibacillus halotolerans]TDQ36601.1 acetyltransferase (GNAT) family protein [Aureibacillus halotolerans]